MATATPGGAGDPDRPGSRDYYRYRGGQLVCADPARRAVDQQAELVHRQFRAMVLNPAFTCVGAASAVRHGDYCLAVLPPLGTAPAIGQCASRLTGFLAEVPAAQHPVAVFVAVFDGPVFADEQGFESALWRQLQGLHDVDGEPTWWNPDDLSDIDDDIGFLFSGRNFFVVGLHPAASRWSRRFGWPVLAFNALSHEIPLRAAGQYDRMLNRIRARDLRLQGSPSPALPLSQTAQFSGRDVGSDWRCPLRPRHPLRPQGPPGPPP